MPKEPAAREHRRPQLDIEIERLHLDPQNPRLPEEIQGKSEEQLLQYLYNHFALEEIADPMSKNGYLDEEPLVTAPQKLPASLLATASNGGSKRYREFIRHPDTQFTVVEGNRRLATARILRDFSLRQTLKIRSWPTASNRVKANLNVLPAIVYPSRKEVLPYLGVRHITGNKKWDSYAKARYIADMLREGHTVDQIEEQVGDRAQGVRKNAIAYYMLKEASEELEWNIDRAKSEFSLLLLAIGQRSIKLYLGWFTLKNGESKSLRLEEISLKSPVPETHLNNLRDLLSWLYGEGAKIRPVINESRDITNYLSSVVASPDAVEHLRQTRNLLEAFDLTDGEEAMLKKLLRSANTKLEKSLGVAHRHKTAEIVGEAQKCCDTAVRVVKSVSE